MKPPFGGGGGKGPGPFARMKPPLGGGGGKGPGPFAQTWPPGGGGGGKGPGPFAQIAGDELLSADSVAAFAAVRFRNPIAPHKTSNTKATTESHFDIETSE